MLGDDDEFFKSNFHNVGLVNPVAFPNTVNLIHENYKNMTAINTNPKPQLNINTKANKAGSRISSNLKSKLEKQSSQQSGTIVHSSMPPSSYTNVGVFSSPHYSPLNSDITGLPLSNQYKTPKKGSMNRNPIKASYSDSPAPIFKTDIQLPPHFLKPPLGKYSAPHIETKPKYAEEYSPTSHLRGLKNDPFLERLKDYKEIYELFKDNYDTSRHKKSRRAVMRRESPALDQYLHTEDNYKEKSSPILASDYYSSPNTVQRKLTPLKHNRIPNMDQSPSLPLYPKKQRKDYEVLQRTEISSGGTTKFETEGSESNVEGGLPSILKEKSNKKKHDYRSISPRKIQNLDEEELMELAKQSIEEDLERLTRNRNKVNESALILGVKEPSLTELEMKRSKSALRPRRPLVVQQRNNQQDYQKFAKNVSKLISNCAKGLSDTDFEMVIQELIEEFKKYHPVLSKFSYIALKEILKGCSIVNIKNQTLYKERENNEFAYLIVYGEVYLKSKTLGVFKQCTIGEAIAEEAVLDNFYTKQETAQVIDQTALLEINVNFINHFRDYLSAGYRNDYILLLGILRKNYSQKKVLRQRLINAK